MNRKDFLKRMGLFATGVAATSAGLVSFSGVMSSCAQQAPAKRKLIGIQLYSVRELIRESLQDTLKGLADCGYLAVEGFGYNKETGYFNTPINEFDKMVRDLGMKVTSSHLSTRFNPDIKCEALDWWKEIADQHKAIGCDTMVIPSLPSRRGIPLDVEYMDIICEYINEVNEIAIERGMRLGFHNHASDEKPLENDKIIIDYLIENTDPTFFIQLDNHNMLTGGRDPIEFLNQFTTRTKALHVKDDDIVGASGNIDFKELFETAAKYDIFEPIVEVESYPIDMMECMCRSYTFLNEAPYVQYYG